MFKFFKKEKSKKDEVKKEHVKEDSEVKIENPLMSYKYNGGV